MAFHVFLYTQNGDGIQYYDFPKQKTVRQTHTEAQLRFYQIRLLTMAFYTRFRTIPAIRNHTVWDRSPLSHFISVRKFPIVAVQCAALISYNTLFLPFERKNSKHFCARQVDCDLPGAFFCFPRTSPPRKNFLRNFQKGGF